MSVDATGDLPFQGDEGLLRRLLLNLLDNSTKYTPEGGCVGVTARREDGRYVLEVTDTGPGVPIEARERIFARFYRSEHTGGVGVTSAGGARLGLAIARWIAEAHGGRLHLARSDARGSTFVATLPAPGVGPSADGPDRTGR